MCIRDRRGLGASLDQDLEITADGTVQLAALAGLDTTLNFQDVGGGATADAVGGYFNGLFVDNYARAYIDDLADVSVAEDVKIKSLTTNNLMSVVEAGGAADDVGVNGAASLIKLGQESLAYIEDRASVTAGHDVQLHAANDGVIVNVAGGVPAGDNVGVGLSARSR